MGGRGEQGKHRLRTQPRPPALLQTVQRPGPRPPKPQFAAAPHRRPLYVRPGVPAHRARDPAERGIVLSRDPGAYATERAAKMADDEAEQERLSGGGCAAELRRLGERLQELERRLCESREPAVEAAAAYCRQLCQVSPSPSAGPERPERGRSAPLCSAAGAGPGGLGLGACSPGCAAGSWAGPSRGNPRSPAGARGRPAFVVGLGSPTVRSLLMFPSQSRRTCKLGVAAASAVRGR